MTRGLPSDHPNIEPYANHMRAVLEGLTVADLLKVIKLLKESDAAEAALANQGTNTAKKPQATSRTSAKASTSKASSSKVKLEKDEDNEDDVGDLGFDHLRLHKAGAPSTSFVQPPPMPVLPFATPTTRGRDFYAVRVGHQVGIFNNWGFTSSQVIGVSGAVYQKFPTYWDALAFFHSGEVRIVP